MDAQDRAVVVIRHARASDTPHIRTIEGAAGGLFRTVGMDLVALGELPSDAELMPYITGQRAWVVTDAHDVPIAFILSDIVDDNMHIEQVSTHPSQAHKGLGAALIEHVAEVAVDSGYPAMTLTTYVDVPWNGPYYARLGFDEIRDDDLTPGLVAIRRHEAELGLDEWPRACMRRALGADEPAERRAVASIPPVDARTLFRRSARFGAAIAIGFGLVATPPRRPPPRSAITTSTGSSSTSPAYRAHCAWSWATTARVAATPYPCATACPGRSPTSKAAVSFTASVARAMPAVSRSAPPATTPG